MDSEKSAHWFTRVRSIALIVGVAAIALLGILNYGTWRRGVERAAIDTEQAGLRRRIDAFRDEETAPHPPYTSVQLQERKARLDAIQREVDALKRRIDQSR